MLYVGAATHLGPRDTAPRVLGCSKEVQESRLKCDWPGLKDLGEPKAIVNITLSRDEEYQTMEKSDVLFVPWKGLWSTTEHLVSPFIQLGNRNHERICPDLLVFVPPCSVGVEQLTEAMVRCAGAFHFTYFTVDRLQLVEKEGRCFKLILQRPKGCHSFKQKSQLSEIKRIHFIIPATRRCRNNAPVARVSVNIFLDSLVQTLRHESKLTQLT